MNNDRFKLRGKRVDNGEWVVGFLVEWIEGARVAPVIIVHDESEDRGLLDEPMIKYFVEQATIEQCTGLRDKNEKLMFGGDIMSVWGYNYIIRWCALEARWYLLRTDGDDNGMRGISSMVNNEIIGNIHDNPELLEV